MAGGDKAGFSDYSKLQNEIAQIEISVSSLLDEMVNSLERAEHPSKIEEKARNLADEARRIAVQLADADKFEMNEKMVELEALEERASELMLKLPDALVYAEQKKWSFELEAITSNLHKMKEGMELLSLPGMGARQRKEAESTILRTVSATKARLENAKDGILHKKQAQKHKTFEQLGKIRGAIGKVKEHIAGVGKEEERKENFEKAKIVALEMKRFIANSLEGKAHIDWDGIRIKSSITGEEMEWDHDDVGEMALSLVFGNTDMGRMVGDLRGRKARVIANFSTKQDSGALMVEFDAGERKILGDNIVFMSTKSRIMV